jgi:glucosamine-6-phosphate deaminase
VPPEPLPRYHLIVASDAEELARRAADHVADLVTARPDAVLALPTGRTPLGLYRELVDRVHGRQLDFSRITVFALDEFGGLPPDHPTSNFFYLVRHLLADVPVARLFSLDGHASHNEDECRGYESAIAGTGGIDLAVLGIGRNGHLGFNEPGSPFDSRTRRVKLRPESRQDLTWAFPDPKSAPSFGLTMGLGTIMEADAVLLLATGEEKAQVLARALRRRPTPRTPASVLQRHPRLTVIADNPAAALLDPRSWHPTLQ